MRIDVVAQCAHGIIAQAPRLDHIRVYIQAVQLGSSAGVDLYFCQSLFTSLAAFYPAVRYGSMTDPIVSSAIRRIVSLISDMRHISKENDSGDVGPRRGSARGEAGRVLVGAAGRAA